MNTFKNCYLLGGLGFIGKPLALALRDAGYTVTVIDRKDPQNILIPDGISYQNLDISNAEDLRKALTGAETVVNLAYTTVPKTSFDDPGNDIFSNIPSTLALFDIASKLGVSRVIQLSSGGTVYGEANELLITEDHPTHPISPYGVTKLTIDNYAMIFHKHNNLPVICLRPSNAYGEGQQPFRGQGLIATAIASIQQQKEITIYGKDVTRDYIHVQDIVSAIIAALERGKLGSIYNVGTGVGTSNTEVMDALKSLSNKHGLSTKISITESRPFDVQRNILSYEKICNDTGWKPTILFDEGLRATWNSFFE